ncbi:hemolysin family protein [Asanoa sp. WMMD1127]|uniref:hemolysin family protein n=1 Tax=Asanoa sp. WMMD1127 TaxID=3016107 RepID=UPI002416E6EC|nr:hemolysin family protein [Asanoa sp. WMMD1127]MDG4821742.1 hemolysin family protein [Asanoa sp. WMMD1127]
MLILAGLALIVVLTLATGFFVAQEFAYVAVDRNKLRAEAEAGDAAAERALRVTSRLSFMLSGAQLGITVTALLAGYFAEPYLGEGLADVIGLTGASEALTTTISVIIALVVATVVQMVVGELAPKNFAIAKPDTLARALSRSTLAYMTIAGPLIKFFDATSNRLLRTVGIEPVEELPQGATTEDLDRIIESSRQSGVLDPDTSRLLDHGLDFRTRTAGDAMVPRVDVVTINADDPAVRVVELLDTGHTRFPVLGTAVDDVRGIVAVADVVDVEPADRGTVTVGSLAAPAVLVPETLPLPAVLERLRAEHRQLACVIDEYGGFAGVISLEDVAEELVGEIHDEDDLPQPAVRRRSDGAWSVPGRWRLDEVAEASGVVLPSAPTYDTVSGLVLQALGRVPRPGDEVVVELPPVLTEDAEPVSPGRARLRVDSVRRHVPDEVSLQVVPA